MYSIKPEGINVRMNDHEVPDPYLLESINLQKRDGSYKPIPKRVLTSINTTLYGKTILHKVGDANQINVLGFTRTLTGFLSEDLSAYLGGGEDTVGGELVWYGTIIDGVYTEKTTPEYLGVSRTPGLSWTILKGLLYFMGDGTSDLERYYIRYQYNNSSSKYESKNMYAWKTLIPTYPMQQNIELTMPKNTWNILSQCGFILSRFTLVLKTGEEVLHSPIYFNYLFGLNTVSENSVESDLIVKNIHTIINMNYQFSDDELFKNEIAAINIYCSIPYYISEIPKEKVSGIISHFHTTYLVDKEKLKGEFQKRAEEPFYLVKTIEKPTSEQLVLSVGNLSPDISFNYANDTDVDYSCVDISTIAAGSVMPVDNFSYHNIYGNITSLNGRLLIERPIMVSGNGNMKSLGLVPGEFYSSYKINTEDGNLADFFSVVGSAIPTVQSVTIGGIVYFYYFFRGLLSYPHIQCSTIGMTTPLGVNGSILEGADYPLRNFSCRKNKAHNMSCVFNCNIGIATLTFVEHGTDVLFTSNYCGEIGYIKAVDEDTEAWEDFIISKYYSSENAIQFSAIGEFSVWPAINSYRVGDGRVVKVGANNVDPQSANVLSMLIVGTTDGVWSINTDPTGNNFVSSITRISRIPYISSEVLQVEDTLFFISDKGLMALTGNNKPISLSYDFFLGQGDVDMPALNDVFPNYDLLTSVYLGGLADYFYVNDIVTYLKGAILSYDSRRNSIWCSNPNEQFSLIFDITNKCWGMSTTVFSEAIPFFETLSLNDIDIYSWYMISDNNALQPYLMLLSGEDMVSEVFIHLLTRPVKFNDARSIENTDRYKKINRCFVRCEFFRDTLLSDGFFSFGMWGKQDFNKQKVNIPLVAISDSSEKSFPNDVRQDIPTGYKKGKYKGVSVLVGGKVLPESSIDQIDFDFSIVEEKLMR